LHLGLSAWSHNTLKKVFGLLKTKVLQAHEKPLKTLKNHVPGGSIFVPVERGFSEAKKTLFL
jgi:hypothetical protein